MKARDEGICNPCLDASRTKTNSRTPTLETPTLGAIIIYGGDLIQNSGTAGFGYHKQRVRDIPHGSVAPRDGGMAGWRGRSENGAAG
jgi:hypothetical protein